ncbi:MAG: TRAP transporter fused permease subunit [Pseudomonadota bacterium]
MTKNSGQDMASGGSPPAKEMSESGKTVGTRQLPLLFERLVILLGGIMGVFYVYSAIFGISSPQWHRGLYLALTYAMAFLLYPFWRRSPRTRPSVFDILLSVLSLLSIGYWIWEYVGLAYRAGDYTNMDFYAGVVGIILSLEICRRVVGLPIALLATSALLYAYFGAYMPEVIAHKGNSIRRLAEYMFLANDGVFGVMTNVMATYVLIFIYLGTFMARSGAGQFFIDFPLSIVGRAVGGPAKVAAVASAVFGSISGAAIANIVATGTFTIPLMKRTGFRPHVAASIENSASTGGQLLPPVMGVGAFVMAEVTGIPYGRIAAIAAIPALLYMLSIFIMVHCEAKRYGLTGLSKEEVQNWWVILRGGWYHLAPLIILFTFLYMGFSVGFSAGMGLVSNVAVSWLNKEKKYRMGPRTIWESLVQGSRNSLIVGTTAGAIGIVIGVFSLTGLGLKFSNVVVSLAGDSLLLALFLVGITTTILGMGLTITASYLVTSILAVPALMTYGLSPIVAHMIVFWFSQGSNFTPPVCLGAYVAASIAKSDPWKTGLTSFKFGKMIFVMPLLFAYTPLLFTGTIGESLWAVLAATVGTIAFSIWSMKYFLKEMTTLEWFATGLATYLCFTPGFGTDAVGVALFVFVYFNQRQKLKLFQSSAPVSGT